VSPAAARDTAVTAGVHPVWGAATDRGNRRALNEDAFLASAPVFVVADGMGGHEAGEVASACVVDVLRTRLAGKASSPERVNAAIVEAHREVQRIEAEPGRAAGTTVSGVVLSEVEGVPYWIVVNLGDSRTYRLAHGALEQISVDHSEVQELIDSGAVTRSEAAHHPRRHVVTRALGATGEADVDYWLLPVSANDRILVCSDGLTGELPDPFVAETLLAESDPQAAAERLVAEAVRAGGRDNVTVIVVDVRALDGHDDASSQTTPRGHDEPDDDTLPRRSRSAPGADGRESREEGR